MRGISREGGQEGRRAGGQEGRRAGGQEGRTREGSAESEYSPHGENS